MKIPYELENPLDIYYIKLGEKLYPLYRMLKFSPNHITFISSIFGVISVKSYMNKQYIQSAITLLLMYMFDCQDGNYARKYDMVSEFGDYFDHVKDVLVYLIIIYMLYNTYKSHNQHIQLITIITIISIITVTHLGCQELYYGEHKGSDCLSVTKTFCASKTKEEAVNTMRVTRYGGTGTLVLALCAYIVNAKYLN